MCTVKGPSSRSMDRRGKRGEETAVVSNER